VKIYNYDQITSEYLGQTIARRDPMVPTEYIMPANATQLKPPDVEPGSVAVFTDGAWVIASDNRGEYYDQDRNKVVLTAIGEDIPEGWTVEPRPDTAEEANEKAKAAIAAQRFALETGGIVDPVSGRTILTDRESQQILDSTIEKIRRGLVQTIRWKCADGWLTLTEDNIDAIEILVLTHVQTAFAWEEAEQIRLGLT
jgi:hypothetical protein